MDFGNFGEDFWESGIGIWDSGDEFGAFGAEIWEFWEFLRGFLGILEKNFRNF